MDFSNTMTTTKAVPPAAGSVAIIPTADRASAAIGAEAPAPDGMKVAASIGGRGAARAEAKAAAGAAGCSDLATCVWSCCR